MKLVLCSVDENLYKAWKLFCGDYEFVDIHYGSILDVQCDAVVSPANSFGFMDGGIDALYMKHFGRVIQTQVQEQISIFHNGELLVGQADIVETMNKKIPFLITAPTMRVPMKLEDSVNPYLAARAIFILIMHGTFKSGSFVGEKISERVSTVAIPGLATGIGGIGANTCANQVKHAIDDVFRNAFKRPRTWAEASERHQLLYTDKPKRLQY